MDLRFPQLGGGTFQGLNDAGVENFQGAIDVYVSRECGQNTGDAHRPEIQTVRLEFDRLTLSEGDIPGFMQLRTTLQSCLERWGDKEKERDFFEQAIDVASKQQISLLRISDYGTTGLTGTDADESGRWFALVKSQGVSNKEDTAGGSFGIGKSSPFAASRFRTVFYGTRTEGGEAALQGVSRLVTHKNSAGKLTQGTGFIGDYDESGGEGGEPVFLAVRNETEIPMAFRRVEPGTDIWVVGYRSGPEWKNDLVRSILTNFWPAVHRGSIQFRVGDQIISKENISDLVQQYVGQEDFEAHHYYRSILNQPIKKRLKHVGDCELYLTTSSADLPRLICMARSSGMRIFDYQPKACRVPFSGLFICTDPEGNKLLRKLEPPKHDAWDAKRIEDATGKKALDEIKRWIREEVKKLNPLSAGKSFNETELAKYLPDLDPADLSDVPESQVGESDEESLEPKPKAGEPIVKRVTVTPLVPKIGGQSEGGFGQDTETGRRGAGNGSGGGNKNKRGGATTDDHSPPKISVRSFQLGTNQYELVLRSVEKFSGSILVRATGEDGNLEPITVTTAASGDSDSESLHVRGDMIAGVSIVAGVPLHLSITVDALERRSLTAVAVK